MSLSIEQMGSAQPGCRDQCAHCRAQELIRAGLELVLAGRRVKVRGQRGNGREAVELTRTLDPDSW